MEIETKRLLMRPFSMQDAAALYPILADRNVIRFIQEPFTLEQTIKFIERAGLSVPPLVYALEYKENRHISDNVPYEPTSYELGWILDSRVWGKGFANEITQALIEEARKRGIPSLVIECHPGQKASCKILDMDFGMKAA